MANSLDSDEMTQNEPSHLELTCLQMNVLVYRVESVKWLLRRSIIVAQMHSNSELYFISFLRKKKKQKKHHTCSYSLESPYQSVSASLHGSVGGKGVIYLRHRGVQLILAYRWARPAILVASKGEWGMLH